MSSRASRQRDLALVAVLLGIATAAGSLIAGKAPAAESKSSKFFHDPDSAQIVTSDIENFWRAYDHMGADNAADVLQKEYLKKSKYADRFETEQPSDSNTHHLH